MDLIQIVFAFFLGAGTLRIGIIIGEYKATNAKKISKDFMWDWAVALMRLQLTEHQLDQLITELHERGALPNREAK